MTSVLIWLLSGFSFAFGICLCAGIAFLIGRWAWKWIIG